MTSVLKISKLWRDPQRGELDNTGLTPAIGEKEGKMRRRGPFAHWAVVVTCALALLSPTLACSPASAPPQVGKPESDSTPVSGGKLVVGTIRNPTSLSPDFTDAGSDDNQTRPIHAQLFDVDPSGSYIPDLAERWDFSDPQKLVVTLRPGLTFHDGTPLNASAIKAQIDKTLDKDWPSKRKSAWRDLASVEVLDDLRIQFNAKTPSARLVDSLAQSSMMVQSPAAVAKFGKEIGRKPVGAGPFEFVEWQDWNSLKLKRFPNYWDKGLPYLDELEFRFIPDPSVLFAALRTGLIDATTNLSLNPEEEGVIKDVATLKTVGDWPIRYGVVWLDTIRPPLNDPRVRKAILYAFDREEMIKGALGGRGYPVYQSQTLPGSWADDPRYHTEEDLAYPYRPDKSKALLQEAGFASGFKFTALVNNEGWIVTSAEIGKAQLAKVGIDMTMKVVDLAKGIDLANSMDPEFTAFWVTGVPSSDTTLALFSFHSSTSVRYKNPKFDPLAEAVIRELDPQKRKEAAYRATKVYMGEDAAYSYTIGRAGLGVMKKNVMGWVGYMDTDERYKKVWVQK